MSTKIEMSVVRVKIADLMPHPRQAEVFADLSDFEINELARSLRGGQLCPIEITPDNIIICGHQRVRAAQILGWEELDAFVREDLAQQGEAAVFDRLVSDNLTRRQLDSLTQARCYQKLKVNALLLPKKRQREYHKVDLRDRLSKQFGMSGRNLDRLVRILSTPDEVQNAVSAKRLSLKAAGQVAGQSQEVQKRIAKDIKSGDAPEKVVKRHIATTGQKKMQNGSAMNSFLRHLRADVPDIKARLADLKPLSEAQVHKLEEASTLINRLLKEVARQPRTTLPFAQPDVLASHPLALTLGEEGHLGQTGQPELLAAGSQG